jgi:hypothetical protein
MSLTHKFRFDGFEKVAQTQVILTSTDLYVGYGPMGAATSEEKWVVRHYSISNGTTTTLQGKTSAENSIWDNYLTLIYS